LIEKIFRKINHLIKKIGLLSLISLILFPLVINLKISNADLNDENPEPFFYLDLLVPATSPVRNQWADLMIEHLPKIGIGVDTFNRSGWAYILYRTWGYPGPYPIPTYDEGGFDLLFVGWSASLDSGHAFLYNSDNIVPFGNNFYQYSSMKMDQAIGNYYETYNFTERITYAHEIQEMLYNDIPSSCIFYPQSAYPMADDLSGMDGLLWAYNYQPMELWSQESDKTLYYACPADFEEFHPHFWHSIYDAQWLRQIYNGLVERQNSTHLWTGRLATNFYSTNGCNYSVELDPYARWADGTDITPEDIIFNYDLLVNDDYGAPDADYYKDYWSEGAVEKVDENTITITFDQTYVFQDNHLAIDLIPKHIWEPIAINNHTAQAAEWALNNPNKLFGLGPYRLEDYDNQNEIIHLKKNEYFSDMENCPEPHFEEIFFKFYSNKEEALSALASEEVDMVDAQYSPQLEELDELGLYYRLVTDLTYHEISYNCLHPRIGTGEENPAGEGSGVYVRRAIDTIIPREIIIEDIRKGLGLPGVTAWSKASIGYNEELKPREYSVEAAKDLMRQAGYSYPEDKTIIISLYPLFGVISGMLGIFLVIVRKRKRD
jgi:ABC-type transport system substrate-binding protein